jgi:predicted O-methyltransferase YrrM
MEGDMNEDACIQKEDLKILLPIISAISPKVIIDIGTLHGGSVTLWKNTFNPDILITIDIEKLAELQGCDYLYGLPSQDPKVVARVVDILDSRKIDFLFIDGSHLYKDIKLDFELYSPFVREGGIIMFHDILYRYSEGDVPTFWKEIKRHYNYIEIAQNNDTTGIGIIMKSSQYERTHHGNIT